MALKDSLGRMSGLKIENLIKKGGGKVAGLDIGSYSLKLVRLQKTGDRADLVALGLRENPPNTFSNKEINRGELATTTIQELMNQVDPQVKEVQISICGKRIFPGRLLLDLQKKKPAEQEQLIKFEIEQRLPSMNPDEVTSGYDIIGIEPGGTKTEVIYAASRNEYASSYFTLVRDAGSAPVGIDSDAFAVWNAYELNYPEADRPKEPLALVHIGYEVTEVAFARDGRFFTIRHVGSGTKDVANNLERDTGMTFDQIITAMNPSAPDANTGKVRNNLEAALGDLKMGLDNAFTYFETEAKTLPTKIMLSGGGAVVPGMKEAVASRMDMPVDVLNPVRGINFDAALFGGSAERIAPLFTVAIGLAWRAANGL